MSDHIQNQFYCTGCGSKGIPIARRKGSEREAGHLKNLYCLKCGTEKNHVECKPFSRYDKKDFLFEYRKKNFTETGVRVMSYSQLKAQNLEAWKAYMYE